MSNKEGFSQYLHKVEELDPEHLVCSFAVSATSGDHRIGVVDYDGNKGDFWDGMERVLALQRASIVVIKDHPKITEAINQILDISVIQEQRISALEIELERVRSEKVAVVVQDQAKSLAENLADRGYATGKQSFTVKIEEEASEIEHSRTERTSDSSRKTDVKGKISGLAKILAGLNVEVNVQNENIERALDEVARNSNEAKKVTLSWEIDTVTPPNDPKAHAHAYRLRTSAESVQSSPFNSDRFWRYIALISLVVCIAALIYTASVSGK